ncbi:MAG: 50S ribosomal protein L11 methyltransferase [Cyanobacteria bacterium P01_H01_bin.74]
MHSHSDYTNMALKLKLNADTVIKVDGSEYLLFCNYQTEDGFRVKYDILLIIYELFHWKTLEALLSPWSEADQEKIISHLSQMEQLNIVVTSEQQNPDKVMNRPLAENLGKTIHINVENHHAMLRDYVRLAAYRRAIEAAITPDDYVLDLGTGTGILAFFAATAGAKKVYAIEKRSDIITLAQILAEQNQLDQNIQFIEGASSHIPAESIAPKATVFISEILGNGILEENVLEYTIDARDRFLASAARIIPCKLDIYIFAYDSGFYTDRSPEVDELTDLYGYNFSALKLLLQQKTTARTDFYNPQLYSHLTEPVLAHTIDFKTVTESQFSTTVSFTALKDGAVNSFCAYFKAHLDENNTLTNSPWAPKTHWTQLIFTLPKHQPVQADTPFKIELSYNQVLRLNWIGS